MTGERENRNQQSVFVYEMVGTCGVKKKRPQNLGIGFAIEAPKVKSVFLPNEDDSVTEGSLRPDRDSVLFALARSMDAPFFCVIFRFLQQVFSSL